MIEQRLPLLAAALLALAAPVDRPTWTGCPENPRTSCTSVSVPVDRCPRDAGRFDVAVARRASLRTGSAR